MRSVTSNILIIQSAFIGDVILATSLVESVKKKYPNSSIHFLLREGNQALLENNPHVDQIWIWNKKKNKYKNLFILIKELRFFYFEYVFCIQRFFSMGLVVTLLRAKNKVGFHSNPLSLFFSKKIKHKIPHEISRDNFLHEVQRNYQLIDNDIPNAQEIPPRLYLSEVDSLSVKKYLGKDYIVIAPTSVWFTKQWALEKWQELVEILSQKYQVYLIGAGEDFLFCEKVKQGNANIENLCGKLSLLSSAALMKKAARVIVNDSAPLHLASSVNAKTTAIFCSTVTDFGYFPLAKESIVIEQNNLICRPCGLHGHKICPLSHFDCAYKIDVMKVVESIN